MANQLLPPVELAPTLPPGLTSAQKIEVWLDLMEACHQLLLAGLRHKVGPQGDVWAAYRQWSDRQAEEHERVVIHLLQELHRRESGHG